MRKPARFSLPFRVALLGVSAACNLPAQQTLTLSGNVTSGTIPCQAVDSITTSGTFTVSGSASVKCEAGGTIHLLPGFRATAGTASPTFEAFVTSMPVTPAFTNPGTGASGPALNPQTFTFVFTDPLAAADIQSFQVSFGGTGATAGICSLVYAGGVMGLWNDAATQLQQAAPLQNSQCAIGNYQLNAVGNTLTFTAAVTFLTSFQGAQEIYALAVSSSGDYAPWVDLGTWTVLSPAITTEIVSTPGAYSWTPAAGVTSVQVEAWGPGGSGANTVYISGWYPSGGGGGGGAYAKKASVAVTPGQPYSVVVGAGGTATKSSFAGSVVVADYGVSGAVGTPPANPGLGGAGGQAVNSVGEVTQSGASGFNGQNPYGGPGGGGANGGAGGPGGMLPWHGNGYPGSGPGGGGGGATATALYYGGAGANGLIVLTHAGPAGTITTGGTSLLTTTVSPAGAGTIGPSCPIGCSYSSGLQVTVTAAASSGYQFNGWAGVDSSSGTTAYVTMNGNRSVTASFRQLYQVTAGLNPLGSGSMSLTTGNYAVGTVPFTVTANSGYALQSLSGNCAVSGTLPNFSINVTGPCVITANFVPGYTIGGQVTASGGGALSGVTVNATGTQNASAITNPSGAYTLPAVPAGGNYTVSASLSGYSFTPPTRTFTNLSANQSASFTTEDPLTKFRTCLSSAGSGTCDPLPPGVYRITQPIVIGRSGVTAAGGGVDASQTILVRDPNYPISDPNNAPPDTALVKVDTAHPTDSPLTGVEIKNLTFCGGSYPANLRPSSACAAAYRAAGLTDPQGQTSCGTQLDTSGKWYCNDIEIGHTQWTLGSQDPFTYNGNAYAVTIDRVVLEDAGGDAISLYGNALDHKMVNDVFIHDSAVNSSGRTGIHFGVTNEDVDANSCDHNPIFKDDLSVYVPRNIRIEHNTFLNNSTAVVAGLARFVGLRYNGESGGQSFRDNFINPQGKGNSSGGTIVFEPCADKIEIMHNTMIGPDLSSFQFAKTAPGLELWGRNITVSDNSISNMPQEGIALNSVFTATVSNNTLTGNNTVQNPENSNATYTGNIGIASPAPGECGPIYRDSQSITISIDKKNSSGAPYDVFFLDRQNSRDVVGGASVDITPDPANPNDPSGTVRIANQIVTIMPTPTWQVVDTTLDTPRALAPDVPLGRSRCSSRADETFTFSASDSQGADNVAMIEVLFGDTPVDATGKETPADGPRNPSEGCHFAYFPASNQVYLDNHTMLNKDTDPDWLPESLVGNGGHLLTNAYCSIAAVNGSFKKESDARIQNVTLPVTFRVPSNQKKYIYVLVENWQAHFSNSTSWKYWGWWIPITP